MNAIHRGPRQFAVSPQARAEVRAPMLPRQTKLTENSFSVLFAASCSARWNRVFSCSGGEPTLNEHPSSGFSALCRTFALRAPEVFQFGFKRRPISAVFGLFGPYFGIERFA